MKRTVFFLSAPLAALVAACFAGGNGDPSVQPQTDLPCDVAQALSNCQACHGSTLAGGAPMSLVSYGDLTAPSALDSTQTNAERAVARMSATSFPMAPLPADPAPQSDIDAIQAWIDAGYPNGSCTPPPGGTNPYDTPSTCTNGMSNVGRGINMRPGEDCGKSSCHGNGFTIAGTVYPTAHEPNDCNGGAPGGQPSVTTAQIVITDSTNTPYTISTTACNASQDCLLDASGNFASVHSLKPPYTVQLLYNGRERDMTGLITQPTTGHCNSCHTPDGTQGAPGRILLP
jgi:mono/diheme cytochrome c family protein